MRDKPSRRVVLCSGNNNRPEVQFKFSFIHLEINRRPFLFLMRFLLGTTLLLCWLRRRRDTLNTHMD